MSLNKLSQALREDNAKDFMNTFNEICETFIAPGNPCNPQFIDSLLKSVKLKCMDKLTEVNIDTVEINFDIKEKTLDNKKENLHKYLKYLTSSITKEVFIEKSLKNIEMLKINKNEKAIKILNSIQKDSVDLFEKKDFSKETIDEWISKSTKDLEEINTICRTTFGKIGNILTIITGIGIIAMLYNKRKTGNYFFWNQNPAENTINSLTNLKTFLNTIIDKDYENTERKSIETKIDDDDNIILNGNGLNS